MFGKQFQGCLAFKGWLASEQNIERATQRINVGTGVDVGRVTCLLGRHAHRELRENTGARGIAEPVKGTSAAVHVRLGDLCSLRHIGDRQ
jgi:hypothetical protein